ncbi:MAG: tetratricopeptide repeat protein [Gemmataceae bacterium]
MRRTLIVLALAMLFADVHGQTTAPATKTSGGKRDRELVERLLTGRKEYQLTLEGLRKLYIQMGDIERARWAEEELVQFHRIPKQAFLLELDVPPPTLKGSQNVPEANKLYRQAMVYKDKGWGNDYTDNMRRAELLFQKILTDYPQSDKISDTAYQLGDIYEGRAYKQPRRAAVYYERSFEWNSKTHFDARIRAARLYDRQLNNRSRAVEIYKQITTYETDDKRIDEAKRRLQEIGGSR